MLSGLQTTELQPFAGVAACSSEVNLGYGKWPHTGISPGFLACARSAEKR